MDRIVKLNGNVIIALGLKLCLKIVITRHMLCLLFIFILKTIHC